MNLGVAQKYEPLGDRNALIMQSYLDITDNWAHDCSQRLKTCVCMNVVFAIKIRKWNEMCGQFLSPNQP